VGTIIFSVAAGLDEVLITPIVAALPTERPKQDISLLHSLYAYGFVSVVIVSTIFLKIAGSEYWMYLTFALALLPVISALLLKKAKLPFMEEEAEGKVERSKKRSFLIFFCFICIFLGAAAENTMSNWISAYAERALVLPKLLGDLLGMSLFAVCLGVTRTLYAKKGNDITRFLTFSMLGACCCYLAAALTLNPFASLFFCVALGAFAAMLWPGTLIMLEENLPQVGVAAYALMAAGGDAGASLAPQGFGIIVDIVSESRFALALAEEFVLTPEQIGFKAGLLLSSLFPLLGFFLLLALKRFLKRSKRELVA